jgi:flavin-dependent dehydrogenase
MQIAVIGGGIGGLTAALVLRQPLSIAILIDRGIERSPPKLQDATRAAKRR